MRLRSAAEVADTAIRNRDHLGPATAAGPTGGPDAAPMHCWLTAADRNAWGAAGDCDNGVSGYVSELGPASADAATATALSSP